MAIARQRILLKYKDTTDAIKTTWRMPKDLIKEFKHLATDRETTVTTLVVEAMKEYLERNNEPTKFYKLHGNIDYLRKEEFVKKFTERPPEIGIASSTIRELQKYLEIKKMYEMMSRRYVDREELVYKFLSESEIRVATVKEALSYFRESMNISK